jgi:3-methyladenine DNA glycosylase AlkD
MDVWLKHPSHWVRRSAMLHQLGWRLDTDTTRLFGYATQLADEKEFFIRKAIGWALRDYARWNPQAVTDFLVEHRASLSGLTVREAAKHLTLP